MANTSKIDKTRLVQLVNEGKTNKEIGEIFTCSVWAVEHAKKRLRAKAKGLPTVRNSFNDNTIDAMTQLVEINDTIISELRRCNKWVIKEDEKIEAFDRAVAERDANPGDPILEQRVKDLAYKETSILKMQNNIVTISGEVRKQIELQLKIAESLYNIQMMQEFQNEVIETIKSIDKETATKIVSRLKERRALRGLVKM
jgi:hypothetical protein